MMERPKNYLPGLNGLRAIAALLVLFHHMLEGASRIDIKPHVIFSILFGDAASRNAVNIFFVISGFLITYLLLTEKKNTNRIDIKRFYYKRTLRIWPLYFLYLFIIIGLTLLVQKDFNYTLLAFLFFAGNVVRALNPEYTYFLITHYWSLGVEQQFYMIWPFAIKKIKKHLLRVLVMIVLITFAAKLISFSNTTLHYISHFIIESRFQFLVIGGIGAVLYFTRSKYIAICYDKTVQFCSLLMIIIMLTNEKTISLFSEEMVSFGILILMMALISGKSYFLHLENKVCNFLGNISYGIYVIHPLVLWTFWKGYTKTSLPDEYAVLSFCLLIPGITIILAYISYQYFEKRFLHIKARYAEVVPSNNSAVPLIIKQPLITTLEKDIDFKPIVVINRLKKDDTPTD